MPMHSKLKYSHYLQLTPMGDFFFGGESFADKGAQNFYFQTSENMPQQTSLLGLLRYQLLLQNGMTSKNGQFPSLEKALFVGGRSFDPAQPQPFGVIDRLSPVFITHKSEKKYFPFPQVKYYRDKTAENNFEVAQVDPVFVAQAGTAYLTSTKPSVKVVDKFNPKLGLAYGFRELDSGDFLNQEDLFVTGLKPKIGIYKTDTLPHRKTTKDSEKEGFFKFQFKRLQKGFAFGFYANLHLTEEQSFQSADLVYLGKDRCPFQLSVKAIGEEEQPPFSEIPEFETGDQVWLIADAHLNAREVNEKCDGALTADRSFRCLISSISNNFNYFSKPLKEKRIATQMQFSDRYNLMRAGSLLNVVDPQGLKALLTDATFNKIGYNHFLKIKNSI